MQEDNEDEEDIDEEEEDDQVMLINALKNISCYTFSLFAENDSSCLA